MATMPSTTLLLLLPQLLRHQHLLHHPLVHLIQSALLSVAAALVPRVLPVPLVAYLPSFPPHPLPLPIPMNAANLLRCSALPLAPQPWVRRLQAALATSPLMTTTLPLQRSASVVQLVQLVLVLVALRAPRDLPLLLLLLLEEATSAHPLSPPCKSPVLLAACPSRKAAYPRAVTANACPA